MSYTPKNIVICCDGTGNQFGQDNSNVVRLYTCLAVNEQQVAYYHPGVGTMGDPTRTRRVEQEWSRLKGLAFALGFTDNLGDAYKYLMNHYVTGDRIYLFGFSRGAYTVRALAGALNLYGLLCAGNEGHLPYLLRLLRNASRDAYRNLNRAGPRQIEEDDESRAFRETFSREVSVHFVGIWDTVSSIGWIYDPVKILYDAQNPIVRKSRHAISVDERRCFYQPMPWGDPLPANQLTSLTRESLDPGWMGQDIVQAWFPGVHSDIGGSYALCDSGPAIESFKWMLAEAELDGLATHPERKRAVFGEKSQFAGIQKWNSPQPRPECHIHNSLHGPWWILECFPHKYFDGTGKKQWQFGPWPHRRELPDGALLHPTLRARLANPALRYRPRNLDPAKVQNFTAADGQKLLPEVAQDLSAQGFGVYRVQPAPRASVLRVAAAAACMGIAAAAFLTRSLLQTRRHA